MSKKIEAEGILSGFTNIKEKNIVTLTVKTDTLTEDQLNLLRDLYQTGKNNLKPKAVLQIIFDNKVHELLGKYRNAY